MTSPRLAVPHSPPSLALLVLSGSSGRVETQRAELLAAHGIAALAVPWFGAPGLPPSPRRVPLESILARLDELTAVAPRVGILGTSFGAEAALLVGVRDSRVSVVVALAPTSVAWETSDTDAGGHPVRDAKWTWQGASVPGVAYVDQHIAGPFDDARAWHDASLSACPDLSSFAIPVEEIAGSILVSAGGDDRVWNSPRSCDEIVARRSAAGLATTYVAHPGAGHRLALPGEAPAPDRPDFPRGGTAEADAEHGAEVLDALLTLAR